MQRRNKAMAFPHKRETSGQSFAFFGSPITHALMPRETDDVSDLSDGGSEHGYRMTQIREAENAPQNQGSPFIHNDAPQKPAFIQKTSLGYPSPEISHSTPRSWPQGPRPLRKYDGWGYFILFLDLLVTFLPVNFLLIAGAALSLNGKPRSTFGDNIIETTKYGTTAFPIVFAAIFARSLRTIAHWRCEKGAKLGLLEQLMGSQSLAGTIERFLVLGRYDLIGILVLLLWILSPFGSQMTLRLLELGNSQTSSSAQIQYFNTTSYSGGGSSFGSASGLETDQAALNSLMGANILSSQTVSRSVVDTWNNVKIPQLDGISSVEENPNNNWINPGINSNLSWASISGIMTEGLSATGGSTFLIETSYMAVSCPNCIRLNTNNLAKRLNDSGIRINNHNASSPWVVDGGLGPDWNSMFLDTSDTISTFNTTPTAPQSLIFGSIIGNSDGSDAGGVSGGPNIDIFNCTLTTTRLEANVTCDGMLCKVTQVRRSENDTTSPFIPPFDYPSYINLLMFIPKSLGLPHPGSASAPDNYLLGSDNPFSLGDTLFSTDGYINIPGPVFAKRLTTLLNTAWQASICPYGIALGSAVNLTACQTGAFFIPNATTNATTLTAIPDAVYITDNWHAIVLLLITLFLQLVALATMALSAVTRAPNVLGWVSSLTRDSPYMARAVPSGGSMLCGAERSRLLGEVRLRLVDVKPGDPVGRIALEGVEGSSSGRGVGKLNSGRVYE